MAVAALVASTAIASAQAPDVPYSVSREDDRVVVTLRGAEQRTYQVGYERSLAFGTSSLDAVVRETAGERSIGFKYREAEEFMELAVDEQRLPIHIQNGIVRLGEAECDGAGGDWSCIAAGMAPLVEAVPPEMMLALLEVLRGDLSGPDTIFGTAVLATLEILIRDRLTNRSGVRGGPATESVQ